MSYAQYAALLLRESLFPPFFFFSCPSVSRCVRVRGSAEPGREGERADGRAEACSAPRAAGEAGDDECSSSRL